MKWLKRLGLVAIILTPAATLLWLGLTFKIMSVPTSSMEPTILLGDHLVIRKLESVTPHRGDLLIFNRSGNHIVKRVVAITGDHLKIHDQQLIINGVGQSETYTQHVFPNRVPGRDEFPSVPVPNAPTQDPAWVAFVEASAPSGEVVVPVGNSFVLGDNRDNSLDSRYLGFFPNQQVAGRPVMVLFSVDSAQSNFRWERLFKLL